MLSTSSAVLRVANGWSSHARMTHLCSRCAKEGLCGSVWREGWQDWAEPRSAIGWFKLTFLCVEITVDFSGFQRCLHHFLDHFLDHFWNDAMTSLCNGLWNREVPQGHPLGSVPGAKRDEFRRSYQSRTFGRWHADIENYYGRGWNDASSCIARALRLETSQSNFQFLASLRLKQDSGIFRVSGTTSLHGVSKSLTSSRKWFSRKWFWVLAGGKGLVATCWIWVWVNTYKYHF